MAQSFQGKELPQKPGPFTGPDMSGLPRNAYYLLFLPDGH
jgi:hypothetical protein